MKEEIKVNKANKSITFINNGIAFSQFGVADEILDLITNLQEENKELKKVYIKPTFTKREIEKYKSRNEKAIEYIGNGNIGIPRKTRDKFIAILKGEDKMNKEEITLEQAEDIVDNMYQQRFKECKVDDENKVHIDNLDNVTFNKLEKASISLLRTEISQKSEIERLNGIINELEKWLQENIKISKAHGNQTAVNIFNVFLDKLKELKGDDING